MSLTLVVGLPGVGKSTVSRILAKRDRAVILNSDQIRRELFPHERTYSSKETGVVIKETERRVEELLRRGENVILDALFTKEEPREFYRTLAKKCGASFRVVYVTASEEVIRERLSLREQTGDASEATFAYYLDRKPHFVAPVDAIRIDNSGDMAETARQVYMLIPEIENLHEIA